MNKQDIYDILKDEIYCVVSTVNDIGSPESAFVGFSINEDLEVMIGMSVKSRKYKNLKNNHQVSLVFIFDGKNTIQYEGVAREITEDDEYKRRTKEHFKKNPGAEKYESSPDNTYIIIEPDWIRLTASGPEVVGELRIEK